MLWKIFIHDKDDHKTVMKNTTYMLLSLWTYKYFPLSIRCNETVSVGSYVYNPEVCYILVKGSRSMNYRDHVLHHMIITMHVS